MPYGPDKLLLNGNGGGGRFYALTAELASAEYLAEEVIELGGGKIVGNKLLREHRDKFLAEQEAICKIVDDALDEAVHRQRATVEAQRKWIDTWLDAQPCP